MTGGTESNKAGSALILDSFLPYRLSVATNLVSDLVAAAYRQLFDINIPEWRLIAVLAERTESNQQGLGEATRMDKLTVSRAAARLAKRGLILRRVSEQDRRNQLLTLSDDGRALYEHVAPKALEIEKMIFDRLSETQKAEFSIILREIEAAALKAASEMLNPDAAAALPPKRRSA